MRSETEQTSKSAQISVKHLDRLETKMRNHNIDKVDQKFQV